MPQENSTPIMEFFTFGHLKDGVGKDISELCCDLANTVDDRLPNGPEKSAGLRKLLEAKDCFVRAALVME